MTGMRRRLVVSAFGCAVALVACAAGAQPELPKTVAADLKAVADQCREVGGKANTANAIRQVDLNGDAKTDFVLYVGSVHCDAGASFYGDREKSVTVYVGDGKGGAVSAFNGWVFDAKIEGTGAAAKLWLTVSGAECGSRPPPISRARTSATARSSGTRRRRSST
ncbi:MAG: hypothetical protein ACREI8_03015 [Myxococcota bacterium]